VVGFEERVILTRSVVQEAKSFLRGYQVTPERIKDHVKDLKKEDGFGWARRVLSKVCDAHISDPELRIWFAAACVVHLQGPGSPRIESARPGPCHSRGTSGLGEHL
jgi:hypothetical protein